MLVAMPTSRAYCPSWVNAMRLPAEQFVVH